MHAGQSGAAFLEGIPTLCLGCTWARVVISKHGVGSLAAAGTNQSCIAAQVTEALAQTDLQDEDAPLEANGDEGAPDADDDDADADGEAPSDQKVVAKFLVSNAAAGSVIGKGGSNIAGEPAAAWGMPRSAPAGVHAADHVAHGSLSSWSAGARCPYTVRLWRVSCPAQSSRRRARRASSCPGRMSTSRALATASCSSAAPWARSALQHGGQQDAGH